MCSFSRVKKKGKKKGLAKIGLAKVVLFRFEVGVSKGGLQGGRGFKVGFKGGA